MTPALTLQDLPMPPTGKSGWPWTQPIQPLPARKLDNSPWPRISVVTPNYNQGQFLEETIRSVLLQGYPNLEYIIIDGASTDHSVEIIKKYEPFLAYWVSERDRGQSHGINKGFERCTGDYIAWMNSSDCYMPDAFKSLFTDIRPDFIYGLAAYGGKSLEESKVNYSRGIKEFDLKYLLRFFYSAEYIIPSQSVFVSNQLLKSVGFLDEDLHYCMDLDWYARIALAKPLTYSFETPICFYRFHDDAKTKCSVDSVIAEAMQIAKNYLVYLPSNEQRRLTNLIAYTERIKGHRGGTINNSLLNLLDTLVKFPAEALSDTRFLGLLKRKFI